MSTRLIWLILLLIILKAISSSSYSQRRTYTVILILLTGIVIGPCSRYSKKGLIYIIIIAPSSH